MSNYWICKDYTKNSTRFYYFINQSIHVYWTQESNINIKKKFQHVQEIYEQKNLSKSALKTQDIKEHSTTYIKEALKYI